MKKYEYIFYSVVGDHAGETVEQIINRKLEEINRFGYSLWSIKMDRKSLEQVWELPEDGEVVVVAKISPKAKDPVIVNDVCRAQKMRWKKDDEAIIPEGIDTTFTSGKNYQAYVVQSYEMLEKPEKFDFGSYITFLKDGRTKSYKERFKCKQFQNTFARYDDAIYQKCEKEIAVLMRLKYPFAVNIE